MSGASGVSAIAVGVITVSGIDFDPIKEITISHHLGEHATAKVVGDINSGVGRSYMKNVNPDKMVEITINNSKNGQTIKSLFKGYIKNIEITYDERFTSIELHLVSTSIKEDILRKDVRFQDITVTYEELFNAAKDSNTEFEITAEGKDSGIGSQFVQLNETNWSFIKRVASNMGAPVIASISASNPKLSVGLSETFYEHEWTSNNYSYWTDQNGFQVSTQNNPSSSAEGVSFAEVRLEHVEYAYVGDKVKFNNNMYRVKSVDSILEGSVLKNQYTLSGGTGSPAGSAADAAAGAGASPGGGVVASGGGGGFASTPVNNTQARSKMLSGIVKEVKGAAVQVSFAEMNDDYNPDTGQWFPYSTVYASSDGSGFYCMPEKGDVVRVFFPSGNEAEAFVVGSVNLFPLENTRHKVWRAPGGKEILLADEGIVISCNDGDDKDEDDNKVYINLSDENGIQIFAARDVNITAQGNDESQGNITIYSKKSVEIKAKHNIQIGTANSYVDIRKEAVTIGAENVLIN